jgi:subtilase family serine protease
LASDLANFDTQMGLPHMCGEPGQACGAGIPTFQHVYWNGQTQVKAPPPASHGTGLQARDACTVETSLDVEWAHAIAPLANIINVTTNPAETQGVQGFPAMMDTEQYIVDHHEATVITQSFGAVEEGFGSTQSLLNLRHAFVCAAADGVTVLASSGDGGTANSKKTPVKNPSTVPYPTVNWPASDPLVTAVGGTYLCTNPVTGIGVDSTDPPANCQSNPGTREIGWIDSGGGFSHVFGTPAYQAALPAGSTPIGDMRGVPDVAFQASSRTGPLVYDSAPGAGGWFIVGGTSCSSPEFSGIVAIADQIAGHRPRSDQPDSVPAGIRAEPRHVLLRRDRRKQPGRPRHPRLPGNHRLGPGDRSRHPQRGDFGVRAGRRVTAALRNRGVIQAGEPP